MKYFRPLFIGLLALGMSISGFAQARRNAEPVPAVRDTVRFRCAYLDASQQSDEKLFVKERKGFRLLNLGVMAFLGEYSYSGPLPVPIYRKATPAEIEQRKKDPLVPKAEVEYVRVYELSPRGLDYFGAILLPSSSVGKAFEKPLVFNLDPRAFPPGAVRIYNFSRKTVGVKYEVQGEPKTQSTFTIRHQDSALTPATGTDNGMFELRAFIRPSKTQPLQEVFRTVGVVQKKQRYCAFLLPDSRETKRNGGNVALTCRTIKILPVSAPSENPDDDGTGAPPQQKRRSSR